MKIILINNLFGVHTRGGAEVITQVLAEELSAQGHEVCVVTACPSFPRRDVACYVPTGEPYQVISFFPWNLYFVGNDHKHGFVARFFWHILDTFNLHSYFRIRKIIKETKPDLVWSHNLKGIGLLVPRAIRASGAKHAHTLHDVQLVNPSGISTAHNPRPYGILGATYEKVTRALLGSPSLVLSPSRWLLNFYEERSFFKDSKKLVLRNPLGVEAAPARLGEKEGEKNQFIYIGQLEEHKGVFLMVEAFQEFLAGLPVGTRLGVCLRVVGSGSAEEKLKKMAKDFPQIEFYGRQPREEVMRLLGQSDFMIFPTQCLENAPTVLAESLASQKPVIASDLGSVPEFITHGKNGILFEPGSKKALVEALGQAQRANFEEITFVPQDPAKYVQEVLEQT